MRSGNSSAQLTKCLGQTEATNGHTIEQPAAIEVGTGDGGQTQEVAPNPVPQPIEVSAKAADDGMTDPEVPEEVEEEVVEVEGKA